MKMWLEDYIIGRHMKKNEMWDARSAADKAFGQTATRNIDNYIFIEDSEAKFADDPDFLRKLIDQTSGSHNQKAFNEAYAEQQAYQLKSIKKELKAGMGPYIKHKVLSGDEVAGIIIFIICAGFIVWLVS